MPLLLIFLLFTHVSEGVASPNSFAQAKKIAASVFANHPKTLYCSCFYNQKEVDLNSCGMGAASFKKRAHRIEWEHIQAAEHFGQQFACWHTPLCRNKKGKPYKGRACCQKINERYRHMESELYNLWPEVGFVNQARSNYRFGMVAPKSKYFGCALAIDKSLRRVEPSGSAKGIVARAYLFMSSHYHIPLSKAQRQLFKVWNQQYAPTSWERQWSSYIASIEGYDNPYITQWNKS